MGAALLVVEDDDDIAAIMVRGLERHGHALERVSNGTDAIASVEARPPDAMLLDLGLPDIDGLSVCKHVRASGYAGGVIVVTARTSEEDVTASRLAGADDFLTKPFGLAELQARVKAVLGRGHETPGAAEITTPAGLVLDPATRHADAGGVTLQLTDREFDALALLATPPGRVVPSHVLVASLWGEHAGDQQRSLAATIKQLRRKLSAAGSVEQVAALDGGYRLGVPLG